MQKSEKKRIAIFLVLLAVVIVILIFVDKKKDKQIEERERSLYLNGIRAEVSGGTPEENEIIRHQIVNKMIYGENGLSFQQNQALLQQFERDRARQAASMGN